MLARKGVKILTSVALFAVALSVLSPIIANAQSFDEAGFIPTNSAATPQQQAQQVITNSNQVNAEALGRTADIGCNFSSAIGLNGSKQFALCVSSLFYWIAWLAGGFAYMGAYFFSYAVQISLNSVAYSLDFIAGGWEITRDIANMAFLFILIYIAFIIMFNAETADTIKMLAAVVVIALIVNFSFLFTRVAIDAGNILAIQFYNAIQVKGPPLGNNTKDLSAGIMNAVQIHSVYSTASFAAFQNNPSAGAFTTFLLLSLVYLGAAIMYVILFFVFLYVGVKFILRIVGLWLVIIASPLAFVARTLRETQHFFTMWLRALLCYSLYPASFLFIFLVTTRMTQSITNGNLIDAIFSSAIQGVNNQGDFTIIPSAIANIGIRMGFIVAMLYYGLRLADWCSAAGMTQGNAIARWLPNTIGGAVLGGLRWSGRRVGGAVGGAARGAGGFAYRQSVGRAGAAFSRSLPGTTRLGDWTKRRAEAVANSSVLKTRSYTEATNARKEQLQRIGVRKDAQRLGEINKTWDKDEEKLKIHRQAKSTLDASGKRELERLEALNTERAVLSKRIENLSGAQVTTLKAADIEGIIKQMSQEHLRAIKDSGKYTAKQVEDITKKWHDGSGKAPLGESRKQVEELVKIREMLEKERGMSNLSELLPQFERYTRTGSESTVTLSSAEQMKKEIEALKNKQEDLRRNAESKEERIAASQRERDLSKALGHLEKLTTKIQEVPEGAGGEKAPAAFQNMNRAPEFKGV